MKMIGMVVCGFLLSVNGNAQEDQFLAPLGKSLSEYGDRIICMDGTAEWNKGYTDKSRCRSYRLNSSDSFRFENVIFNGLFFHRDTGKLISSISYFKSIKDKKRSQQVKRANEEFRLMSEWLDKFCGTPGVVRQSIPPVKDQKYKYTDWVKGPLKFTLQQVDVKNVKVGNGFSTLDLWIEKKL